MKKEDCQIGYMLTGYPALDYLTLTTYQRDIYRQLHLHLMTLGKVTQENHHRQQYTGGRIT